MITNPLQRRSSYQLDGVKVEAREVHGRSTGLIDSAEAAAIDEEIMKEYITAESIY